MYIMFLCTKKTFVFGDLDAAVIDHIDDVVYNVIYAAIHVAILKVVCL